MPRFVRKRVWPKFGGRRFPTSKRGKQPQITGGAGKATRTSWTTRIAERNVPLCAAFRQPAPFPARMPFRHMTYAEDFSLTSGIAGVVGTIRTYYLNSIYSPVSSGGHQPYGFDQLSGIYN